MSDSENKSFPSTKDEALTMLYLQNLNFANEQPEKIVEEYQRANKRIKQALSTGEKQRHSY